MQVNTRWATVFSAWSHWFNYTALALSALGQGQSFTFLRYGIDGVVSRPSTCENYHVSSLL